MNMVNCMACGYKALEKDFYPHDCVKRKHLPNDIHVGNTGKTPQAIKPISKYTLWEKYQERVRKIRNRQG